MMYPSKQRFYDGHFEVLLLKPTVFSSRSAGTWGDPQNPSRLTALVKIMFSIWPVCREIMKRKSVSPPMDLMWGFTKNKIGVFWGPRNPQMNYTTGSTGHSCVWWACSVAKIIQNLLSVKIQGLYIKVSPTRTPDFYKIAECLPCLAVGWFLGQRCHWDAVTISWYILIS